VAERSEEVARQRVLIVLTAIAVAPIFRIICHFLGTRGRTDEFFPAVADILAIGCLLAFYSKRMPKIQTASAAGMIFPVLFVPLYMGVLRFHTTALLLFVLWPLMHFSIAGLLLHVVQRPYWILNVRPLTWLGQLSYGLYGSSCLRLGTSAAVVLSTARGRNCSGLILSTGAADNPAARTK
jgi:peptidoglycan/LPS O-acetylase OafA/YrhL